MHYITLVFLCVIDFLWNYECEYLLIHFPLLITLFILKQQLAILLHSCINTAK